MVDIHQHLLYGIDDGPESFADTKKMLGAAGAQGIETVIATSHALPGRQTFPRDKYLQALKRTRAWLSVNAPGIQLLPGNEIFYSPKALPLLRDGGIFTLGGTDAVLVEFHPDVEETYLFKGVRELANAGYLPVLAHTERYACLRQRGGRNMRELIQMDVKLQVNARSVVRSGQLFGDRFLGHLLKDGYVDYVATDAHDMGARGVCMREGHRALVKMLGREEADALCGGNQQRDLLNW